MSPKGHSALGKNKSPQMAYRENSKPCAIPTDELYPSSLLEETLSRLDYAAERQLLTVVTGDCRTGKTTTIRKFTGNLNTNPVAATKRPKAARLTVGV